MCSSRLYHQHTQKYLGFLIEIDQEEIGRLVRDVKSYESGIFTGFLIFWIRGTDTLHRNSYDF